MAVLERHQDLVEELLAEVEAYKPDADRELLTRAFDFAARAHAGQVRRSGQEFVYHPWGVARILAGLQLDEATLAAALLHDVVEDTSVDSRRGEGGVRRRDRPARRGRHQADARPVPEPRARGGRELPQADHRDGGGPAGHPDQARRPPAQPAHDRVPRQAEAAPEGAGDARGLRAARASPRHPRAQVGARGPRVPDAASAQVRGDQADGLGAARRPRGARARGGDGAAEGARQGRHPRRDLGAREALLFDLRQDGEEGSRVQRDLRPDRDARDRRARRRRGNARLLRRARSHPFALEADARSLQGLHRDAEVQRLPRAAHDGDRSAGTAARDSGAHARDARDGRVRRRRALALQARQEPEGRGVGRVGEAADGRGDGRRGRPARVHEDVPHRPLRRRGARLHAEGPGEDAARRLDADRLRVRRAHRCRPPHRRREGERPDRPAALHAEERRLRRDPHGEAGPRAVARLAVAREELARAEQDPAVVLARDARGAPSTRAARRSSRR